MESQFVNPVFNLPVASTSVQFLDTEVEMNCGEGEEDSACQDLGGRWTQMDDLGIIMVCVGGQKRPQAVRVKALGWR